MVTGLDNCRLTMNVFHIGCADTGCLPTPCPLCANHRPRAAPTRHEGATRCRTLMHRFDTGDRVRTVSSWRRLAASSLGTRPGSRRWLASASQSRPSNHLWRLMSLPRPLSIPSRRPGFRSNSRPIKSCSHRTQFRAREAPVIGPSPAHCRTYAVADRWGGYNVRYRPYRPCSLRTSVWPMGGNNMGCTNDFNQRTLAATDR